MATPAKGMQRGLVDAPAIAGVSVLLLVEMLLLGAAGRFGDFTIHGNSVRFVSLALAAGLFYLAALKGNANVLGQHRAPLLWGAAIALRLVVFFMPPGDDLWRYLWEGKIQAHGFNPYLASPDSPALTALREEWWSNINHRDYAAIYPPGIELVFALLARVSLSVWLFKGVFAFADLTVIWLLLKLNTGPGRYQATAWYAWNPGVVLAFAGAGHYDSLLLLTMLASMLALHRANPLGTCKPALSWLLVSALLLGVAISIKTVPIFLVPLWAFAFRGRWFALGLSAVVPAGLALQYGGVEVAMRSLTAFTKVARFNDLIWWAVDRLVWPNPGHQNTRYVCILLLVVCVLTVLFRRDWRRGTLWIVGAILLLSPVLHPWYATWILPVACWQRGRAWFLFAVSVLLAYTQWDDTFFGPAWSDSSVLLRFLIALPLLWSLISICKNSMIVPRFGVGESS